jgi:hypothetical protein
MKKEKKMMAMLHRVDAIMKKSDELSRLLSMKIVEEAKGEESALVALYALAKTVFDVVDAQMAAGHEDAMKKFVTLLEAEIQAKVMMEGLK